ncbi:MAG: REP-associated tyrosine transposase [Methylophilaceae bacterium]
MNSDKPHAKNLRKGRVSLDHQVYHIIATTFDRKPVFADFHAARLLIAALRHEAERHHAETLAFVVMPDNSHWLMQLAAGQELASIVGAVKSVVAHQLGERLWQAGFYDHALRRDEDLPAVARYIVANPLRAGLVQRLGDYPHWDAVWL